jgi:uncharacterized protein YcfL
MKTYLSLLTLGIALFTFGCSTEGPYVPAGQDDSTELENTSVLLDAELVKLIAVDNQQAERTSQGKLKAMANVRNRLNKDITVQTQTVFRDANGFSINDDTSWETIVLTANETRTISATSTSKKAERYTIRIRLVR